MSDRKLRLTRPQYMALTQQEEEVLRLERMKRIRICWAENSGKRANDLNGVSFGELIRQLGGEVS